MILKTIEVISNLVAITAGGIAIYLFFAKRESIKSIFNLLVNYSFQTTLGELRTKLEKLNDHRASDHEQLHEISCILNDISGQIRGNEALKKDCQKILRKIDHFIKNIEDLTEPKKRSIVSELRETLRNIDVSHYDQMVRRQ